MLPSASERGARRQRSEGGDTGTLGPMKDEVKALLAGLEPGGEGELCGHVQHGGQLVSVDIEGDPHAGPGPALIGRLDDLEALGAEARAALAAEHRAGEGSVVELYRAHHAEELEPDEIEACFGDGDAWRTEITVFMEHCVLTGVAVLLAGEEPSLMVDLQLGGEMTDQVLCVAWDPTGRVLHVDMES